MLIDKQFLWKKDQKIDCLYKVTEVKFLKQNWKYLVWFEGCSNYSPLHKYMKN